MTELLQITDIYFPWKTVVAVFWISLNLDGKKIQIVYLYVVQYFASLIQRSVQVAGWCRRSIRRQKYIYYHPYSIVCDLMLIYGLRSLCLSTDEAFEQGKSLPFINPSSLETLRALVQEIQSSGETDPEIWKDCEVGDNYRARKTVAAVEV